MNRIDRETAETLLLMGLQVWVPSGMDDAARPWIDSHNRCTQCTHWIDEDEKGGRPMASFVHYDCHAHRDREFKLPEFLDEIYVEGEEDN